MFSGCEETAEVVRGTDDDNDCIGGTRADDVFGVNWSTTINI